MGSQDIAKTRLGDLLIERGLITDDQLHRAIAQQKECSLQLGEILVANGWVSHRQINQALRRQSKLRNAILTSFLSLSPMVLVGCGSAAGVDPESPVAAEEVVTLSGQSEQGDESESSSDNEQDTPPETNESNTTSDTSSDDVIVVHVDVGEEDQSSENTNTVQEGSDSEASTGTDNGDEQDVVVEEEVVAEEETVAEDEAVVEEETGAEEEPVTADLGSTIQLTWSYPEKRTDGSDLEVYDVESFRVYQLSEGGEVGEMHEVDGLDTQFEITDLADGEYHFAITVVDSDGNESDLSEAISVSVL